MGKEPRQTRRVLLGSLLLAGLIGSALLIFFLETLVRSLRSTYTVVAVVQNAPDLTTGSPVWIAGRHVGEVQRVGFAPASGDTMARIAVVMELPRSVQSQVRTDSRVRLTAESLMGGSVVDILPGTADAPVVGPGDTLRQAARPTASQLAARAARLKADFDSVLATSRELSPALRVTLTRTERAFQGLDLVMQESGRLQRDLADNPGLALLRDPAFAASLARVSATADELPRLFGELTRADGGAAQVGAALGRLQARADSLAGLLAAASDALVTPNGTLLRLQQDTAIQRAIAAARADLDSLIADVRRNPLRYAF
jgi:phospholipid/cholesterol/gamma-HCH transport system substrate-binding protein